MTNPYEHLSTKDLQLRNTMHTEAINTLKPDDPEAKDRMTIVHDMELELQRRSLGEIATSHTAQQTPGGAPIDTERWRK